MDVKVVKQPKEADISTRNETRKRGHALNLKKGSAVAVTLRGSGTEIYGTLSQYQDGLLILEQVSSPYSAPWVMFDRTSILYIRALVTQAEGESESNGS